MSTYDQVEIEDMTFDPDTQTFSYPCPCGDKFQIYIDDMFDGEEIAVCPSCSLMIQVIFEQEDLTCYYEEAGTQPPEPIPCCSLSIDRTGPPLAWEFQKVVLNRSQ